MRVNPKNIPVLSFIKQADVELDISSLSVQNLTTSGSNGTRGYIRVIDKNNDTDNTFRGDYNPSGRNPMDVVGISREIEPGVIVICGHEGYKGCVHKVYMHSSDIPIDAFPVVPNLDADQLGMLEALKYKGSYRSEYWRGSWGLMAAGNPKVDELIKLGMCKKHGIGLSLTASGKETLVQNKMYY